MATPIPAIDADGHFMEHQDEIRPYLDDRWKGRETPLWPGGQPWDPDLRGRLGMPCGYSRKLKATEQVELWHRILDDYAIEKAVLFPTGSGSVAKNQELAFAAGVARAANRHFAHDYMTDRLFPVGVLPMRDPQAAAREVEYASNELGLKGFEVVPDGLPFALGDPFFDPIYEAAESCGATIGIHGTRAWAEDWGAAKLKTFAEVHCYAFPAGVICNFTSVVAQGIPKRFPKLKMGFLEIGATWLPYYLDRLDEHWEKRAEEEMPLLDEKPSQVFRESSLKVSIEGKETLLRETIDFVGAEHLIYATDVPHWDGEFPENLEEIRAANNLSDGEKKALLHDNTEVLFSL
ncbi:MAG: amidohydrolase family protein [Alphaproteobacteria bacterium]|nr:amidohydrolase family protein [Alphaproteobacteria bacterium]